MQSLAVLRIEAFSRANEGNFTVPLAEHQKIRYNQNMNLNKQTNREYIRESYLMNGSKPLYHVVSTGGGGNL